MRGLIVQIYKTAGRSASNGGISETHDQALLVGEGIDEIFEAGELPIISLHPGNLVGTVVARPHDKRKGMMGGAYVASSDSRFSRAVEKILGCTFYGAVALHDRFE